MVSWKGGLLLLAVLAGLAAYLLWSQPKPTPSAFGRILPCDVKDTVWIRVEATGKVVEVERAGAREPWRVKVPVDAPADPVAMEFFTGSLHGVVALNSISRPQALDAYGLDPPSRVVTCRVNSGASYTLSVGKPSFDGSGYYAQRRGDSRVLVISAISVDEFDRELAQPPVQSTPTPAAPSPRPS